MRALLARLLLVLGVLLPAELASGFSPEEQERVIDESLARLVEELGGSYGDSLFTVRYPGGKIEYRVEKLLVLYDPGGSYLQNRYPEGGLGSIAASSTDDQDPGRHHLLGATLYEELSRLSAEDLDRFLEQEKGKAPGGNVSARFLAHHWRALRLAARARDAAADGNEGPMRLALREEALALSHLLDAFSASHFFHPGRDLFDWLHRTNTRERHERFRFLGAYIMDSRGQVWQGFGDGLLRWHHKTKEMVQEAVDCALREFFAVYYATREPPVLLDWLEEQDRGVETAAWVASWLEPHDGTVYYEELRLPSLLRVPMEARASWSERDSSRVEHGIAARRHWPQMQESGEHDPGLSEALVRELPHRDELPSWLRFPRLANATPEALVLEDAEVASVRFDQQRRLPPTFKGGLLIVGGGRNLDGEDSTWLLTGGLGWGIADRLLPLRRLPVLQRMSVEMRGHWNPEASDAYGVFALATQLNTGRWPGALHLELGLADGWQGRYTSWGLHLGIGLASSSVKLPGIYAGGMVRLRYSVAYMGEAMHSVLLDFLVH